MKKFNKIISECCGVIKSINEVLNYEFIHDSSHVIGFCDGAFFPKRKSIGYGGYIVNSSNSICLQFSFTEIELEVDGSVARAELLAIKNLMEICLVKGVKKLTIYSDCQPVVVQLSGFINDFKIKSEKNKSIMLEIKELQKGFDVLSFKWIRREVNRHADSLSRYTAITTKTYINPPKLYNKPIVFNKEIKSQLNENNVLATMTELGIVDICQKLKTPIQKEINSQSLYYSRIASDRVGSLLYSYEYNLSNKIGDITTKVPYTESITSIELDNIIFFLEKAFKNNVSNVKVITQNTRLLNFLKLKDNINKSAELVKVLKICKLAEKFTDIVITKHNMSYMTIKECNLYNTFLEHIRKKQSYNYHNKDSNIFNNYTN